MKLTGPCRFCYSDNPNSMFYDYYLWHANRTADVYIIDEK